MSSPLNLGIIRSEMPKGKKGKPPEDKAPPVTPPPVLTLPQPRQLGADEYPADSKYDQFLHDQSPEILLEGSLSCAKTSVALMRLVRRLKHEAGTEAFLFRYSDEDTRTKLRPAFEKMCLAHDVIPKWDNDEKCYNFANGSKCSAFGLRSVDTMSRYSKMKGLGVAEIVGDEVQELPGDLSLELRARLRQPGHALRLVFICNPQPESHWICKQFRDESTKDGIAFNRSRHRKVYSFSVYDNPFLPAETLRELEAAFPPEHAKHATVVLGKRGVNVIGDPVYGELYQPMLHSRPIEWNPDQVLYEAFDFGKTNPCWVVAQKPMTGGLYCLGGILGLELFLDDFLPIVKQHRAEWFPNLEKVKTCCTSSLNFTSHKTTQIKQLRDHGFTPMWNEHANDPDQVLAMIEQIASYMRRRSATGKESFGVNEDEAMWLRASSEGVTYSPFMSRMCLGGLTWDEHEVSVGRNKVRQPREDGWFDHANRSLVAIELNFGLALDWQRERDRLKKNHAPPRPIPNQPQSWMV